MYEHLERATLNWATVITSEAKVLQTVEEQINKVSGRWGKNLPHHVGAYEM